MPQYSSTNKIQQGFSLFVQCLAVGSRLQPCPLLGATKVTGSWVKCHRLSVSQWACQFPSMWSALWHWVEMTGLPVMTLDLVTRGGGHIARLFHKKAFYKTFPWMDYPGILQLWIASRKGNKHKNLSFHGVLVLWGRFVGSNSVVNSTKYCLPCFDRHVLWRYSNDM